MSIGIDFVLGFLSSDAEIEEVAGDNFGFGLSRSGGERIEVMREFDLPKTSLQ